MGEVIKLFPSYLPPLPKQERFANPLYYWIAAEYWQDESHVDPQEAIDKVAKNLTPNQLRQTIPALREIEEAEYKKGWLEGLPAYAEQVHWIGAKLLGSLQEGAPLKKGAQIAQELRDSIRFDYATSLLDLLGVYLDRAAQQKDGTWEDDLKPSVLLQIEIEQRKRNKQLLQENTWRQSRHFDKPS